MFSLIKYCFDLSEIEHLVWLTLMDTSSQAKSVLNNTISIKASSNTFHFEREGMMKLINMIHTFKYYVGPCAVIAKYTTTVKKGGKKNLT